ncbi:MAG TPA: hypothetical protein ENJ00_10800 [Phycisphaerales bacterium]|nr:hypothetical protein [Phycisphaerales bacterium]
MRQITLLAAVLLIGAGCAQQQGRRTAQTEITAPSARPQASAEPQDTSAGTEASQPKPDWRPAWWYDRAKVDNSVGAVRACGYATDDDLLVARRRAIESARAAAEAAGGNSTDEQILRTITNPDSGNGYAVWVEIETSVE